MDLCEIIFFILRLFHFNLTFSILCCFYLFGFFLPFFFPFKHRSFHFIHYLLWHLCKIPKRLAFFHLNEDAWTFGILCKWRACKCVGERTLTWVIRKMKKLSRRFRNTIFPTQRSLFLFWYSYLSYPGKHTLALTLEWLKRNEKKHTHTKLHAFVSLHI